MRKVKQQHRDDGCAAKENDGSDQAREILSYYQDLAPHRTEKVKMQTAVNYLAAEEIHENPGAAEEHDCSENQATVKDGVDHLVPHEVLPFATRGCKYHQD